MHSTEIKKQSLNVGVGLLLFCLLSPAYALPPMGAIGRFFSEISVFFRGAEIENAAVNSATKAAAVKTTKVAVLSDTLISGKTSDQIFQEYQRLQAINSPDAKWWLYQAAVRGNISASQELRRVCASEMATPQSWYCLQASTTIESKTYDVNAEQNRPKSVIRLN